MKKLIPALLCLAIFAGCKKNDSASTPATSKIVGKWYLKQETVNSYYNADLLRPPFVNTYTDTTLHIQFNKDGTGTSTITEYSDIIPGSYGALNYTFLSPTYL